MEYLILLDACVLSRMQFAANISFHILFPSISIGLAWFLLFFKWRFSSTQDTKWIDEYGLWVKIFALSFALGVVSGITMSFQFGTNWPGFMQTVGNIAGPLLGYEVLTAFFLEATFLSIMLYGIKKVSNRVHTFSTFLVAFGTTLSAFWIIALISWMHTPTGFEMINGKACVTSWYEIIFNPSMPYRLLHVLVASGLTVSFLMAGISAYRYRINPENPGVLASLKVSLFAATFLIPLQILVGDLHGLVTLEHQPAKIAAIEAIWNDEKGADLRLFAIPDSVQKKNHYEVRLPKVASLILKHDLKGEIKGLSSFEGVHPPVAPIFFAFRIMVGVGFLMLFVSWWGSIRLYRSQTLTRSLSFCLVSMTFSGWIATLTGWYTTEIGRQPWLVSGVLLTKDAVATNISSNMVLSSLVMYVSLYIFLILAFVFALFFMARRSSFRSHS